MNDHTERPTVVFVERHPERVTTGWFHVRVQYPGTKPHTLVSVPSEAEAVRAARGYATRYGWEFIDGGAA